MGLIIANIVVGLICAGALFVALMSFKLAAEEKKARIEQEKKQLKEQEIDNEILENLNEVTSGNFDASFDAGVDVLHQLANKRK